jgi:zinc D-Ala-D-Ala dipeptidase
MAGEGRGINRRTVVAGFAALPLAACNPAPPKTINMPKAIPGSTESPNGLLELVKLDPGIQLDIRYATKNNVTGMQLYDQPRAFMVAAAAQALLRAHAAAKADGYGLMVFDAYRPWRVTKLLWDATPPAKREFVANPKYGSKHNRGCAVDLSLYDRSTGLAIPMPSEYDEFGSRAYRDYAGGSAEETANRGRLEQYMEAEGFKGISNEWWHFDYRDWASYPILDTPFSDL